MTISQNQLPYSSLFGNASGSLVTDNGGSVFGSFNPTGAEGHLRFTGTGSFNGGDPAGLFSLFLVVTPQGQNPIEIPIILSAVSANGGYFSFSVDVRVGSEKVYDQIVNTVISQSVLLQTTNGYVDNQPENNTAFSFRYWYGAEPTDQLVSIYSITAEFI